MPNPTAPAPGPLHGLRVLELSETVAGAYCGRLLSGLGAAVALVEPPRGNPLRRMGPFPADTPQRETGATHLHFQRGKQSLTLALETAAGRRGLASLLDDADALIVDLPRERWPALALEPDQLLAQRPGLVVATLTPFGTDGPKADWQATELTAYAAGGYLRITGEPDREPIKAWGEQAHLQAGLHATLGTLAALRAADRDGEGQHVDVAVAEAVSFLLGGTLQNAYFFDQESERNGTRLVGFGPRHTYPSTIRPCRDGYIHAHCNNRFPETMALLFDQPRLAEPDLLDSLLGHADEIDALMAPLLERRDRVDIVREAQALRIPFTEVLQPSEVLADVDGHHAARGFFLEQDHPAAGPLRYPGPPVRLGATPWRDGRAPLLNEHAGGGASPPPAARVRWRRAGVA